MSRTAVASVLVVAALVVAACGGAELPPPAPAPPSRPHDPAVIAAAAKACARVSGCTRAAAAPSFRDPGACVAWWVDPESTPFHPCLEAANTCEDVAACIHGGGDPRTAAFCAQRPGVVSGCDGDRLVSCGDDDTHEAKVVDCAAIGGNCRELKSGGIVVRACTSAAKCPAGGPDVRCDGKGAVISCRDGAYERIVCAAGTKCEEHRDEAGDSAASCELPGRPRCLGGVRACEGDRLVECERGHTKVTDCGGQGLRCTGVGPRAACSVPEQVECAKELLPRCQGSALVFCAAGRLEEIGCTSIGFSRCDPDGKGSFAACSPAAPEAAAK